MGDSVIRTPHHPEPLKTELTRVTRSVPAVDAYALRLVASHKLYDDGTFVRHSPSLSPLAPGEAVRVNPADLERLGVTAGDSVRVTSSRMALTLPVEADPGVPRGVAALAFGQPGPGAADLIDASSPVTDVRLENL
jgi:anaerobic selenocysteine-containing dehydrogenase